MLSGLYMTADHALEDATAPESDLVSRLRAADPSALGEVYDRHHEAVRAFGARLLGDASAAEDLVHDVFVALPRAISGYRTEASLRTFLVSIAVNQARHHIRSAVRKRRAEGRMALEPIPATPDPENLARRRELSRALSRALDRLSLDHRVAFVLCEVEERTSKEVASIVGAPEATVRTRLFHAKQKLRAALAEEGLV
jgi:RNA polymerase sigma-70 factor, ECF subfamily